MPQGMTETKRMAQWLRNMLEERFILLHKGAAVPEQDKNLRQLLFSQMVLSFRDMEVFFKKANPSG